MGVQLMDQDLINILNRMKQNCKVEQDTHYDCPICEDKGYTFKTDEHGYEVAVPCKCLAKKQSIQKMNRSGLTEVFKQKTINSFKTDKKWQIEAKFKVKQYIEDFLKKGSNAGLILSGQPGSGKTHLGIGTMLELINNNIGCVYKEYITMLTDLKQTSMDETDYIRTLEKYINPRVLFLDDFLKGQPTEADRKYIYKVINTRYLKGKPIIISTEKSIKEILEFDEAVGSRIVEMAQNNIITFPRGIENNYRLRNII